MSRHIWYIGNGQYLEGEEAYEYIRELNKKIIDLQKSISIRLEGIKEYIEEYAVRDTQEYEDMYENVMEAGERCITAAILLKELADYIDERIE